MKRRGFIDLDFAKLDIAREKRKGFPEIIYAPGKTTPQLKEIIKKLKEHTNLVFISRLKHTQYKLLRESFPTLTYFKQAG
ncbi:MAG: 1-(5-phosphoribosyl)-5-amino-4-imidazole-carboxylate carboxylase, partial [Candidatus Omnitrophota bacterium]